MISVKKIFSIAFFLVFLTVEICAQVLTQDWYKHTILQSAGINPKKVNDFTMQSKGLNNIFYINGTMYVTSLDKNNNIVISKRNGPVLSQYITTDLKAYKYNNFRGAGTACADEANGIYFTYINSDGSVSVSKIFLPGGKEPEWNINIKLKEGSKYLPLDSISYYNFIYILICEDEKNYYVIKISRDGTYKTINPPLITLGASIKANAIAAAKNYLYVYGSKNDTLYIAQYDLNGNYKSSYNYSQWKGAVTRVAVYDDNDIYALYQDKNYPSKHRLLKMKKNIKYVADWAKKIDDYLDVNSLYAADKGVFIGYAAKTEVGFLRYSPSGNLEENKKFNNNLILAHVNIYYDKSLYIISSLENGNGLFFAIPVSPRDMFVYNPDGGEYKDFAVAPSISFSESGNFKYKIKYVNYRNLKPDAGYPKLFITKNGVELEPNGFLMTEEDSTDDNYTDGKIYEYNKQNLEMGTSVKYSYRIVVSCQNDQFNSETYYAPIFGDTPRIMYMEGGRYIFPEGNIFANTNISAKMKFFEPSGLPVHQDYPKLTIYDGDLSAIINTKMRHLENNNYVFDIGNLSAGAYSYKIEAQNSLGISAAAETGSFEILAYAQEDIPKILYFDGNAHIFPKTNKYVDTDINARARISDPNNYALADGYPVLSLYNTDNAMLVYSAQMKSFADKAYHYYLGKLPAGRYKYKIEAKNSMNIEAVPAEGVFTVNERINEVLSGKIFNAPNPFNPAIGQSTKIVFMSNGNENVKIKIYTLMGDKVFEDNYKAVNGTNEYEYGGKDNNGRMLYNGTYLCIVEKASGNGKFKMLIIK